SGAPRAEASRRSAGYPRTPVPAPASSLAPARSLTLTRALALTARARWTPMRARAPRSAPRQLPGPRQPPAPEGPARPPARSTEGLHRCSGLPATRLPPARPASPAAASDREHGFRVAATRAIRAHDVPAEVAAAYPRSWARGESAGIGEPCAVPTRPAP